VSRTRERVLAFILFPTALAILLQAPAHTALIVLFTGALFCAWLEGWKG
jgi:hypothetical protein